MRHAARTGSREETALATETSNVSTAQIAPTVPRGGMADGYGQGHGTLAVVSQRVTQ